MTEGFSSMPVDKFSHRAVSAGERDLWPGSYVAHPVAFAWTPADGVDEWLYGVVSGYTVSELMTVLHVVCQDGSVRLPLTSTTSVIKVDVLNYTLQTGARANTAAVSPRSYWSSKTRSSRCASAADLASRKLSNP